MKIKRRNGRSCEPQPMDETNNCYDTRAFIDRYGVYHQGMPVDAVAPAAYSGVYLPYDQLDFTIMILIVRDNKLRVMFESPAGNRIVSAFAFDLPEYTGGRVGLFTFAHQAQFSGLYVGELSGPNTVTTFCSGKYVRDTDIRLCTDVPVVAEDDTPSDDTGSSSKKNKLSSNSSTIIVVLLFIVGVFYGKKQQQDKIAKEIVEAAPSQEVELHGSEHKSDGTLAKTLALKPEKPTTRCLSPSCPASRCLCGFSADFLPCLLSPPASRSYSRFCFVRRRVRAPSKPLDLLYSAARSLAVSS